MEDIGVTKIGNFYRHHTSGSLCQIVEICLLPDVSNNDIEYIMLFYGPSVKGALMTYTESEVRLWFTQVTPDEKVVWELLQC